MPPTAWPVFKRSSVAAFERSVTREQGDQLCIVGAGFIGAVPHVPLFGSGPRRAARALAQTLRRRAAGARPHHLDRGIHASAEGSLPRHRCHPGNRERTGARTNWTGGKVAALRPSRSSAQAKTSVADHTPTSSCRLALRYTQRSPVRTRLRIAIRDDDAFQRGVVPPLCLGCWRRGPTDTSHYGTVRVG